MIRGTTRSTCKVEKNINAGIHNRFDIEVVDSKTGKIRQRAKAENVICDQLWSRLFAKQSYFNYIQYGRGSGTPSSTDKALFSPIRALAVGTAVWDTSNAEDGVFWAKRSIQIAENVDVGETITEVGISYSTGSTLCTHAMLKDMNGNPISINKTATDVINIHATVYVHYSPTGYDNGSIRIIPNIFTGFASGHAGLLLFFAGVINVTNYTVPSQAVLQQGVWSFVEVHSGSDSEACSFSVSSVGDVSTKTFTLTMSRIAVGYGNFGNIRTIMLYQGRNGQSSMVNACISLTVGGDWYKESVIEAEAVGTGDGSTVDYALKFPGARDAAIYVDGVKNDSASVSYIPPTKDYIRCLQMLHPKATPNNHILTAHNNQGASYNNNVFIRNLGLEQFYYNPFYTVGVGSITVHNVDIYASDDLENWELVVEAYKNNVVKAIPEEYRHKKYWKFRTSEESNTAGFTAFYAPDDFTSFNVHFDDPPAEGAVITADYKCDCIAKDANHVFDLTITIQLGEYNEA